MRFGTPILLAGMLLASCTGYISNGQLSFIEPIEEWRDWQGNCIDGQICWSDMETAQLRNRLSLQETRNALFEWTDKGTVKYLGAGGEVDRGDYRLERGFMLYRNEPCVASDPSLGMKRVGVGVRITADLKVGRRGADLGDLIPIALAVESKRVNGSLRVQSWGIDTRNPTLAGMITNGNVPLTREGIEKAAATLSISEKLVNDPTATLTPSTFAVVEASPGSCSSKG